MSHHEAYLDRCYQLAQLSGTAHRPNPRVGAVVVYKGQIIGEGYHQQYGGPHAEVHAINNVQDKSLLPHSTIYVSLEPCCHYGKTPPCTDLIIASKIPHVVVGCVDPFDKVAGGGIARLRSHGIKVEISNQTDKFEKLIAEFTKNQSQGLPYCLLKWAKSKDHYMGKETERVLLSNEFTNVYTHKFRAFTDAILIGTNTAILDNPSLTTRNFPGKHPLRVILDRTNRLPASHHLLSDEFETLIINASPRAGLKGSKKQEQLDFEDQNFIINLLRLLYKNGIYHLTVEGGKKLLTSFIKGNYWDEALIINTNTEISDGIKAPNLQGKLVRRRKISNDEVLHILN